MNNKNYYEELFSMHVLFDDINIEQIKKENEIKKSNWFICLLAEIKRLDVIFDCFYFSHLD